MATAAGRQLGLDTSGASLFRVRSSTHVDLPAAGALARIEAPADGRLAERQVAVARFLEERRAPVARLINESEQPIVFAEGSVTVWRRLDPSGRPDWVQVGRAVRRIHNALDATPPPGLPAVDLVERVDEYLRRPSPWSGSEELELLRERWAGLVKQWPEATREDPLGLALVHGDVHAENVFATDEGIVLIDLEDAGVGPASLDFAPVKTRVARYGVPATEYQEFVEGYGASPGDWPGLDLMCQVYEMLLVAWAMLCSGQSQELAAEARVRVDGTLGRSGESWTLM